MSMDFGTESVSLAATETEPQSNVEGENGASPSADITATILARIDKIDGAVRALQSNKDKGVRRVESRLNEIAPVMEQVRALIANGVTDPDAITREIEYQEMRRRILGEQEQEPSSTDDESVGNGRALEMDGMLQQVATGLGMKLDDPEVVAVIRTKQGADAVAAIAELAKKRAQAPTPTLASAPAVSGGTVQSSEAKEAALVQRLGELQKSPSQNRVEIANIKKQLGWK